MRDNGNWQEKLRNKALKNLTLQVEYEQFKLEFELAK
ncbi:MAG: hypothetical protein K0R94_1278 [Burkholderiales bacterium]|jgi:hypothetical protein|nr:hypothetical protein [Burkholderiales bacterium]